ncbi:transglycosylase SLT domain-containing protein [Burkholderia sp. BCC0044]|uniref:transglycosylase SLT domain-containing protein n=1 Tax=Burkholderia sp. BCC0044 TaxID=2676295 RepID=UPI00158EF425|nr:transglycosylase SLT domain-containing protein [Burkholderia sp. BCC0044]
MQILSTVFERGALVRRLLVAVGFAVGTSSAVAKDCFSLAGERHDIDPLLLVAIAEIESSMNPRAFNRNRNGTYDLGLMQINSTHLPRLSKAGITKRQLIEEPCTAIDTGASILAGFVERHGYTWNAVGAYNAGSAPNRTAERKAYATKVWQVYRKLTSDRTANMIRLARWRR